MMRFILTQPSSLSDKVSMMSSPVSSERRQFGLLAAVAIVVGESIALGMFLTPATMAKSLGSPLLLALV
jgi:amino acid transporter